MVPLIINFAYILLVMLNKTISGNTVEVTCICSCSAFVAVIDVFKKKLVTHYAHCFVHQYQWMSLKCSDKVKRKCSIFYLWLQFDIRKNTISFLFKAVHLGITSFCLLSVDLGLNINGRRFVKPTSALQVWKKYL